MLDFFLFVDGYQRSKKRRVAGFSSKADFVDLEDSQSDDVMCSQYVNDDSFGDKSSSDVEMLSEVSFFICSVVLYCFTYFSYNVCFWSFLGFFI